MEVNLCSDNVVGSLFTVPVRSILFVQVDNCLSQAIYVRVSTIRSHQYKGT